jgi:hypothetical protein
MDALTSSISLLNTVYKIYAQISSSGTQRAEEHLVMKNRLDSEMAAYAS